MRISDGSSDVCSSDLRMLVDAGLVLAVELVDKKSEVEEIGVEIGHRLGDPRTWTARVRVRKREIDANRGTAGAQSEINLLGERGRSTEERLVGKECVSTCRPRRWPDHSKNKTHPT